MKKILFMTAVVSVGILLLASVSMATYINPDGGDGPNSDLQYLLDSLVRSPSVAPLLDASGTVNDAIVNDAYWAIQASNSAATTFVLELSAYSSNNVFGVFDAANPGSKVALFNGANDPGDKISLSFGLGGEVILNNTINTGVNFAANAFGFYIQTPNEFFYSDDSLNSDLYDHMVAFRGNGMMIQLPGQPFAGQFASNEYILAFEDLPYSATTGGPSDRDYQDLGVLIESVNPNPIPEPTTMLLLGLGLVGLAGIRRKFKSSKS